MTTLETRAASPIRGSASKRGRSWPGIVAVGGCLSLHWQVWSDRGADPWIVEVLRWEYRFFLPSVSHLIQGTHPLSGLQPQFHQGQSLEGRNLFSVRERSDGPGSLPFSRLLQPFIHGDENLQTVEADH